MDRLLHRAEAFLLGAVVVVGHLDSRPGGRPRRRPGRADWCAARAAHAAARRCRASLPRRHGGSPSLEIGEHVGEAPAGRALLGPVVEVARMAADIDHAVDRGRAADHLAARRGENAAAEMRLGLRLEAPVGTAFCVAVIKVGGADRGRGEGEEGPRRRCAERNARCSRGRYRSGRWCGLNADAEDADGLKLTNDDQKIGINIVRRALQAPARQIAENAGEDGAVVAGKILDLRDYAFGYNAQTGLW